MGSFPNIEAENPLELAARVFSANLPAMRSEGCLPIIRPPLQGSRHIRPRRTGVDLHEPGLASLVPKFASKPVPKFASKPVPKFASK